MVLNDVDAVAAKVGGGISQGWLGWSEIVLDASSIAQLVVLKTVFPSANAFLVVSKTPRLLLKSTESVQKDAEQVGRCTEEHGGCTEERIP